MDSKIILLWLTIFRILIDIFKKVYGDNNVTVHRFDFSWDTYILSWVALIIILGIYRKYILSIGSLEQKISQQFVFFILLLSIIPVTSNYGGGGLTGECFFSYCLLMTWFLFILSIIYKVIPINIFNMHFQYRKFDNKLFIILSCIFLLVICYSFFYYMDGSFYLGGLYVYEQRTLFAHKVADMPRFLVYMLGMANVAEVSIMLYCLYFKKYIFIPVLLIISYMHFSLAGDKIVCFGEIICVIMFCLRKKLLLVNMIHGACIMVLICTIEVLLHSMQVISTVYVLHLLRRVILEPARLMGYWYDYFTTHDPLFWGISTDCSTARGIDNLIAKLYLNEPMGHADNGLLSDCVANMGDIGILIYPIALACILVFCDYAVKGKEYSIFGGMTLLFAMHVIDSMLSTVMITHGGLLMIVLLWLFPAKTHRCS